ncbi:hypothetical protein [Streptomyces spectabilis]|uniref:Uncharacterized protein n=1 Tax=Streptomyces spectabilis TaxID=68270 RepID=A0A5P2WYD3_STRST|nr:hypothetical protein [Streptomyces spectabilis]MBB5107469.1 hypothetical protein [Streptomyces spectabilis]MCI3900156.1 hypothetical protein [Streptomyces spectabilis]QEV57767.1 hypothetical protein CP982_02785 [Streptomyces spectabilis]GGV37831.1 hypothetical protein GCM10010245_60220 [Streptomyces spectabilis]
MPDALDLEGKPGAEVLEAVDVPQEFRTGRRRGLHFDESEVGLGCARLHLGQERVLLAGVGEEELHGAVSGRDAYAREPVLALFPADLLRGAADEPQRVEDRGLLPDRQSVQIGLGQRSPVRGAPKVCQGCRSGA